MSEYQLPPGKDHEWKVFVDGIEQEKTIRAKSAYYAWCKVAVLYHVSPDCVQVTLVAKKV